MNAPATTQNPINDPKLLRDLYGIRFHHFHDLKGRLVATIVTEPIPDVKDDVTGDTMVAVNAAILFRGSDPVKALIERIERAIREEDEVEAKFLVDVALASLPRVKEADVPSRARGREIALGRLFNADVDDVIITETELKEAIANRTILQHFDGGKNLKLRPRAPFVPKAVKS